MEFSKTIYKRLLAGVKWSLVSTIVNKGAVVLLTLLASQQLSVKDFATYGIALGALAIAQSVSSLSIGSSITRLIAKYLESDDQMTSSIVIIGALTAALTTVIGGFFILIWHQKSDFSSDMRMLMYLEMILFLLVQRGVLNGVLSGLEAWRPLAISNISIGLCFLILGYFKVVTPSLINFFLINLIGNSVGVIMMFSQILYRIGLPKLKNARVSTLKKDVWKQLFGLSVKTFILGLIPSILYFIVQSGLANMDVTGTLLANFIIVWQLSNMVLIIPSVMARSYIPVVVRMINDSQEDNLFLLIKKLAIPGFSVALFFSLGLMLLGSFALDLYRPNSSETIQSISLNIFVLWALISSLVITVEFIAVAIDRLLFPIIYRLLAAFVIVLGVHLFSRGELNYVGYVYVFASSFQLILLSRAVISGKI